MRGETFSKIPWATEGLTKNKVVENFDERYAAFLHQVQNLNPHTIDERRDAITQIDTLQKTLEAAGKLDSGNGLEMQQAMQDALDRAMTPDAKFVHMCEKEIEEILHSTASADTRLYRFMNLKKDLDELGISTTQAGKILTDRIDQLSAGLKPKLPDDWDETEDTKPGV